MKQPCDRAVQIVSDGAKVQIEATVDGKRWINVWGEAPIKKSVIVMLDGRVPRYRYIVELRKRTRQPSKVTLAVGPIFSRTIKKRGRRT